MIPGPLKLLILAYGLAAIAAGGAVAAGQPFWLGAVIFWLGGAAAAFGIAAIPRLAVRLGLRSSSGSRELARWDDDRSAERAAALAALSASAGAEEGDPTADAERRGPEARSSRDGRGRRHAVIRRGA
jgi:hypothetical protein